MAWRESIRVWGLDLARLAASWGAEHIKLQSSKLDGCQSRAADLSEELDFCKNRTAELSSCLVRKSYLEGWQQISLILSLLAFVTGLLLGCLICLAWSQGAATKKEPVLGQPVSLVLKHPKRDPVSEDLVEKSSLTPDELARARRRARQIQG